MSILSKINNTGDIQNLKQQELKPLCKELRKFLIQNVSKTGGHLSSNLGVVELTVALEYIFDIPKDKIIWDVGHQTYIHKILTGRKSKFDTLRKKDGLSGFPKSKESESDSFLTGHSSTSISAAFGMAKARDMKKNKNHVIAVIGDGSMTGGLAYEALNNAGRSKSNLIVILNDNQMSIDDNVGALCKHLNSVQISPSYRILKSKVKKFSQTIPVLGKPAYNTMEKIRDGAKLLLLEGALFEKLGFKYIGPIDGHNLEDLVDLFAKIKTMEGPIFVHVKTKKGKGYLPAEKRPDLFHGVGTFDVKTGEIDKKNVENTWSMAFGDAIVREATNNPKVVGVTASMCKGTGLESFHKVYPNRFYDVGIAEQHATTFSAGLSSQGFIPIFAVYSSFLQRAYDQILHDVCIDNHHVIFAIDRAGIVGADGETHQGLFDLSYLSHIPNLVIMAPKNKWELEKMLSFAINNYNAPIAIRYPRGTVNTDFRTQNLPIELGRGEVLQKGKKICLMAVGNMVPVAIEVAKRLYDINGYRPMVVNMRFITPLDNILLDRVSKKCSHIFTIEDNIRKGGFGSGVLEYYSDQGIEINVTNIAFPKTFVPQGEPDELYAKYGMNADGIYESIINKLGVNEQNDDL